MKNMKFKKGDRVIVRNWGKCYSGSENSDLVFKYKKPPLPTKGYKKILKYKSSTISPITGEKTWDLDNKTEFIVKGVTIEKYPTVLAVQEGTMKFIEIGYNGLEHVKYNEYQIY